MQIATRLGEILFALSYVVCSCLLWIAIKNGAPKDELRLSLRAMTIALGAFVLQVLVIHLGLRSLGS